MKITKCLKCKYECVTELDVCRKCGGQLEILAEEDFVLEVKNERN